jgi:hypothetical protein
MQISSASNLNWLTSSAALGAGGSASSAAGQDSASSGVFGTGTSTQAPTLASLSSPSQLFSSGSLAALISAQTDSSDPTSGSDQTGATSGHHHHHHGAAAADASQEGATDPSATSTASTAADASQSTGAQALSEVEQMLTALG